MPPRCQSLAGRLSTNRLTIRTTESTSRTFASSTPTPLVKNPLQKRRGGDLGSHLPKYVIPQDAYIPPYPYGPRALFKQANRGLYGGQMIQFGNNVSDETETKTRRYWKPNVLSKSLFSVALKKKIKLRVTAKVLKIIDREGGLDEYLLKDSEARIKELGPMGWALRWTVMQRPEVITRLRAEAAALGVDQATIDRQWPTVEMMAADGVTQVSLEQPEHEVFEETEGQEMWDPAEDDVYDEDPRPIKASKREIETSEKAVTEYIKAAKAASRYLSRGVVDNEEDGLKLAFIREKEREEARLGLKKAFDDKITQLFSDHDIQQLRTKLNLPPYISDHAARKIAYNQWKRQQIEAAGGIEAWKAVTYGDKVAAHKAKVEQDGGPEVRKAEYAKMIEEAETATTNEGLEPKQRAFLETAMRKADMAINAKAAGGEADYAQSLIAELRAKNSSRSKRVSGVSQSWRGEKTSDGDAWAALVDSSNRSTDSQPRV